MLLKDVSNFLQITQSNKQYSVQPQRREPHVSHNGTGLLLLTLIIGLRRPVLVRLRLMKSLIIYYNTKV
jgi:hypothetical protein